VYSATAAKFCGGDSFRFIELSVHEIPLGPRFQKTAPGSLSSLDPDPESLSRWRAAGEPLGTGKLYKKSYGLPPVAGGGVEVPQRPGFSIEALSLLARCVWLRTAYHNIQTTESHARSNCPPTRNGKT
jgi:hypothetical protein